jgi:hypothetical protein
MFRFLLVRGVCVSLDDWNTFTSLLSVHNRSRDMEQQYLNDDPVEGCCKLPLHGTHLPRDTHVEMLLSP